MTSNAPSSNAPTKADYRSRKDDVESSRHSTNDPANHRLSSLIKGDSEIEQLAERIEARRAERIPVTFEVRKTFLKKCRNIARERGCGSNKIPRSDLLALRDEYREKVEKREAISLVTRCFGWYDTDATMLQVLERGVERVDNLNGDYFYYQDFNFYYMKLVSKWPWMRNPLSVAALVMFTFYFFTPIFFCHIISDSQVCPSDPDGNRAYYGWLTSLYFASTTMSTVGYGDVTVEKSKRWHVFVGIVYMVVSLLVALTAFSAAAERAFSPIKEFNKRVLFAIPVVGGWSRRFIESMDGDLKEGELLYKRVRRMRIFAITEITIQFLTLNVLGLFVARIFVHVWDADKADWTWMTTFYWSVQTTTTIGYGDLDMPFEFRWFQIIFLTIGTYFVGNVLGRVGTLNKEISEVSKRYAWRRREVSKGMIEDMQAYDHDDKVDQYEFVVSSLLTLGKIRSDDIRPIMDKFREAAGHRGFIQLDDDGEAFQTDVSAGDEDSDERSSDSASSEAYDHDDAIDCY